MLQLRTTMNWPHFTWLVWLVIWISYYISYAIVSFLSITTEARSDGKNHIIGTSGEQKKVVWLLWGSSASLLMQSAAQPANDSFTIHGTNITDRPGFFLRICFEVGYRMAHNYKWMLYSESMAPAWCTPAAFITATTPPAVATAATPLKSSTHVSFRMRALSWARIWCSTEMRNLLFKIWRWKEHARIRYGMYRHVGANETDHSGATPSRVTSYRDNG